MRPPAGAISLAQAARLSGYHQDYLGQLCRAGKLSATKIGRTWFTTETAVRDFLRSLQGSNVQQEPTFEIPEPEMPEPELQREPAPVSVDSVSSAGPQIVENLLISEVQGMPIALRAKPARPQSASLDGVITRVRLQQVQRDLAVLTDTVNELVEQVEIQGEKIDSLAKGSAVLKHTYVPSLEFGPTRHVEIIPERYQPEPAFVFPLPKRILVVSGSMLLIAFAFLFAANTTWQDKFFGGEVASETIYYNQEPQVAGRQVIVPTEISAPTPTVTNSNSSLQQVPPAPTTPTGALGGVEAGKLLQ